MYVTSFHSVNIPLNLISSTHDCHSVTSSCLIVNIIAGVAHIKRRFIETARTNIGFGVDDVKQSDVLSVDCLLLGV